MVSKIASRLRNCSVVAATILALASTHSSLAQVTATSSEPPFGPNSRDSVTQTPIKHVIIIVSENRTFDHVFATYVPVHTSRDLVLLGVVS